MRDLARGRDVDFFTRRNAVILALVQAGVIVAGVLMAAKPLLRLMGGGCGFSLAG